eukprot:9495690-Pyramimonas_sp.AAC.1
MIGSTAIAHADPLAGQPCATPDSIANAPCRAPPTLTGHGRAAQSTEEVHEARRHAEAAERLEEPGSAQGRERGGDVEADEDW